MYIIFGSILALFSFGLFINVLGIEGNTFWLWVIIISSAVGSWYCFKKHKDIEEEKKFEKSRMTDDRLKRIPDHKSSQRYTSANGEVTLSIDESNKKITIIALNSFRDKAYSYRDILKSEILTDGVSVSSTNRGSQLGGALLGGLLAGGVGAMIGGLSGSSTIEEKVKKIELNVIVNDTANPIHKIAFLDSPFPYSKNTKEYKDAYNAAYHCHQLMGILIKQADEEDKQKEATTNINNLQGNISVADELRKLVQLKEEGIISEDEFEAQKKKLIG